MVFLGGAEALLAPPAPPMHTIYPVKSLIARYSDIDDLCSFCKSGKEVLTHLFFECKIIQHFWKELTEFIFNLVKMKYYFTLKDIIVYYENNVNKGIEYIVNLFILLAKLSKNI